MKYLYYLLAWLISFSGAAQEGKDWLIAAQMDIVKSDYDGYFEKIQSGLEANYFVSKYFTVTGGVEYWTREGASGILGTRWYPAKNAFVRLRLLGGVNDVSIGGGFAKPMTEKTRFEAMTDFYFAGNFTIRAGFSRIIFNKK